ncbi:hypothetical protein GCM10011588_68550 [Nocardia jinanensis]|uniref:Uncharacterized protein n=1 Tax=Nocardia jinanensis TaxID=382504 RepID=A0A917RXZ3_9NOCA|nr:hypothetical protein GCM10011588_68550 [Nocardia jinanensis]
MAGQSRLARAAQVAAAQVWQVREDPTPVESTTPLFDDVRSFAVEPLNVAPNGRSVLFGRAPRLVADRMRVTEPGGAIDDHARGRPPPSAYPAPLNTDRCSLLGTGSPG